MSVFSLQGRCQSLGCAVHSVRRGLFALSMMLFVGIVSSPASAETLEQALADSYLLNPVLNAERARLRAIDEQVAIAKSGLRPNISGSASTAYQNQNSNFRGPNAAFSRGFGSTGVLHPHGFGVTLSQLLFGGFQNLNAVREAKSLVQAQRETLRQVEQNVLLDAATAYVNVVRDQAVVRLRENDVRVLTEQLKATRDRFDVGEVTRTDVAQAEARRSEALATLATAQANLKTSRATYEQVVGHPPGNLVAPPSIRHLLPNSLDEAMTLGDGENPAILTAVYNEESSLYAVERIMGEMLPSVTLEAAYDRAYDISRTTVDTETTSVTGRVSVPLYQGGGVSARVRQAKETNNQLKREVEDARLRVHADVISNWGILQSSGPAIRSAESAVAANKIALTGVREEEKVGQRTTLDVLDAQRELLNSQIGLVSALRDRVVAEYSLYSAIGRMDAQTLGLSVPYYDPFEHYELVKNKLWGLAPPEPPLADN
ncbi:MAG: TolC family outer membrane protein [Pseudomonadota bacterium]